ncbi:CbiQ family ECF transporter T component, partial [Flavonifractor plautii]
MGTDRYAYQSRLRRISPMPKLLLTGSALVLCLLCDSVTVGLVTLLGMWGLVTALGGLSPRVFLRFLCVPMAFLAIGCVTILINSYPQGAPVLLAVPVGERLWGFDGAALLRAGRLFCKALGAVGAMYFLALNTPVTDVTMALERMHVPHLLVELMELIYRFIFVLTET